MSDINLIGNGLNPDDLWRNFHWLRERIEKLEAKVRELEHPRSQLGGAAQISSPKGT
jgi:predicted dienelactone hydrolase